MSIEREEVERIAGLANLRFEEEELEAFAPRFRQIVEYITRLEQVEVGDARPLFHPLPADEARKSLRADEVQGSLPIDKVMQNAPEPVEGQFRVPRVIDSNAAREETP